MSGEKDTYYHYTTKESAKKIKESGVIKQSKLDGPRDDARYGNGTYLTKISPDTPKHVVAKNNYDSGDKSYTKHLHKTVAAVEVHVPKDQVKKCPGPRDIHIVKGDVKLGPDAKIHYP